MEEIKIANLIKKELLDLAIRPYFTEQLVDSIKFQEEPSSGFGYFLWGYSLELGLKDFQKDYKKSINYYNKGVQNYLDPLCAFRLADIYSHQLSSSVFDVQQSKNNAFCYLIIASSSNLLYGIDLEADTVIITILKDVDILFEKTQNLFFQFCSQFDKSTMLYDLRKFVVRKCGFEYKFKNKPNSIHFYYEMIRYYISYLTENKISNGKINVIQDLILIITQTYSTQDKLIQKIVNSLNKIEHLPIVAQLTKILEQQLYLQLKFKEDLISQARSIEYLFEMHYLIKNIFSIKLDLKKLNNEIQSQEYCAKIWINLKTCFEIVYQNRNHIKKQVHKSLTIRLYSELIAKGIAYGQIDGDPQKGLSILEEDFKIQKSNQNLYAMSYYLKAKLQMKQDIQEFQQNFNKAEELFENRLKHIEQNEYDQIICNFYLSRICRYRQDEAEVDYLYKVLELIQNKNLLKHVRTIQYHIILKKTQQRLFIYEQCSAPIIPEEQEKLQKLQKDDLKRAESALGNTNNADKHEQHRLIDEYRKKLSMQRQNLANSQMHRKFPFFWNHQEKEDIKGPQIINIFNKEGFEDVKVNECDFLQFENIESSQLKTSQISQDELFQTDDGINYVLSKDINQKILQQKGPGNTCTYKVYLNGQRYSMKKVFLFKKDVFDGLFNHFKKIYTYDHKNIRKIKGIKIEKISQIYYNLGMVYEYAEENLYSYARNDSYKFQQRLQIGSQIIDGLLYLHNENIIIGNLKPSNILIKYTQHQQRVVISDWEICRSFENIYERNMQDLMVNYTSPEVYLEDNLQFNSDVWSLGIVFLLLFFQIDLGVDNQTRGLYGKKQVQQWLNQDIYKEDLQLDLNALLLPEYLVDVDESKINRIGQIIEKCTKIEIQQRPSLQMVKQLLNDLIND